MDNWENKEWDIAISFQGKEDQEKAQYLKTKLEERFDVFVYMDEQRNLVNTDAAKKFNIIFGTKAKLVIVLFSDDWGNTEFTRVEQNAIFNRQFALKTTDFIFWIKTNSTRSLPEWEIQSKIYARWNAGDIDNIIAQIENRYKDLPNVSKSLKPRSILDKYVQTDQIARKKITNKAKIESRGGLEICISNMSLLTELEEKFRDSLKDEAPQWNFILEHNERYGFNVKSYGYYLSFKFYEEYNNSASEAYLLVNLYRGDFDQYGAVNQHETNRLVYGKYEPLINLNDQFVWKEIGERIEISNPKILTNQELIDFWNSKLYNFTKDQSWK